MGLVNNVFRNAILRVPGSINPNDEPIDKLNEPLVQTLRYVSCITATSETKGLRNIVSKIGYVNIQYKAILCNTTHLRVVNKMRIQPLRKSRILLISHFPIKYPCWQG